MQDLKFLFQSHLEGDRNQTNSRNQGSEKLISPEFSKHTSISVGQGERQQPQKQKNKNYLKVVLLFKLKLSGKYL